MVNAGGRSAVLLAALLGGCSAYRISDEAAGAGTQADRGEIRLEPTSKGGGWFYDVGYGGALVARVPGEEGPWLLEDLEPGTYLVGVHGPSGERDGVALDVKAGRRSSLAFSPGTYRCGGIASEWARVTGKAVAYPVLAVGYVLVVLPIQVCLSDKRSGRDEPGEFRCSTCGERRCRCSSGAHRSHPSTPDPDGNRTKPRVRSLLKDPP